MTRDAYAPDGSEARLRRQLRERLGDLELEIRIADVQPIGSKTRAVSRGHVWPATRHALQPAEHDHALAEP
jgi:hypothetical protein